MEQAGKQGMLVPQLINLMADAAPWLVGLLAVCALAAMQSTGAAYMSTAGGMLTRDLPSLPDAEHPRTARRSCSAGSASPSSCCRP